MPTLQIIFLNLEVNTLAEKSLITFHQNTEKSNKPQVLNHVTFTKLKKHGFDGDLPYIRGMIDARSAIKKLLMTPPFASFRQV